MGDVMQASTASGWYHLPIILTCWLGLALCFGFPARGEAVEGVPCTAEPTDMGISYGDLVICSIDIVGDSDVFRFSGSQGDNIVLRVTSQSNLFPCLELRAPDNTQTFACAFQEFSQRIDKTLTLTGTYTVLVTSTGASTGRTGAYALALEKVAPPSFDARSINYGETFTDEINPTGDIDLFSFEGTAGDSVVVQVTSQSNLFPCLELRAPDNTRTFACAFQEFSQRIDKTLTLTGTYTVLVTSTGASTGRTGAYALGLQCVGGLCKPVVVPDASGCIKLKGSPLVNQQVILTQNDERKQRTTTDANGCYKFDNVVSGKSFKVIIRGPLVP
jgi:hypothetical protein